MFWYFFLQQTSSKKKIVDEIGASFFLSPYIVEGDSYSIPPRKRVIANPDFAGIDSVWFLHPFPHWQELLQSVICFSSTSQMSYKTQIFRPRNFWGDILLSIESPSWLLLFPNEPFLFQSYSRNNRLISKIGLNLLLRITPGWECELCTLPFLPKNRNC